MAARIMPYKISAYGLSDVGLVRQNNEDFWKIDPSCNLYVLADGMGGHRAGEVASKLAVDALCGIIHKTLEAQAEELTFEESHGLIQFAIEESNAIVYNRGKSSYELRGMGTTLCCIYFHPKGIIYAHVGDSRIYRLRDKKLEQLTNDHSLLTQLLHSGRLTEEEASEFAYKNIITKAIGTEEAVEPSVSMSEVQEGDTYLMCSDGLSDLLALQEIEKILNTMEDLSKATKSLVEEAKRKGGHDNVTVVLMRIEENNETKDLSR